MSYPMINIGMKNIWEVVYDMLDHLITFDLPCYKV